MLPCRVAAAVLCRLQRGSAVRLLAHPLTCLPALPLACSLLLSPNVVSLPLSHAICKAKRNVAVQSGFFTVCLVLAFIFATGSAELLRHAKKARHADLRGDMATMATIDYLRCVPECE